MADQIRTGASSKEDVLALLGTPTVKNSFGQERWIYLQDRRFKDERVVNRIEVTFDKLGYVDKIQRNFSDDLMDPKGIALAKAGEPAEKKTPYTRTDSGKRNKDETTLAALLDDEKPAKPTGTISKRPNADEDADMPNWLKDGPEDRKTTPSASASARTRPDVDESDEEDLKWPSEIVADRIGKKPSPSKETTHLAQNTRDETDSWNQQYGQDNKPSLRWKKQADDDPNASYADAETMANHRSRPPSRTDDRGRSALPTPMVAEETVRDTGTHIARKNAPDEDTSAPMWMRMFSDKSKETSPPVRQMARADPNPSDDPDDKDALPRRQFEHWDKGDVVIYTPKPIKHYLQTHPAQDYLAQANNRNTSKRSATGSDRVSRYRDKTSYPDTARSQRLAKYYGDPDRITAGE
jgi:hypothetical protein